MSDMSEDLLSEMLQDAVPIRAMLVRVFEDRLSRAQEKLLHNKASSYDDYLARFAECQAWERVIREVNEILTNQKKGLSNE